MRSFDASCAAVAAEIYQDLKSRGILIETDDILIAATAISHDLRFATINRKHFERIPNLKLVSF